MFYIRTWDGDIYSDGYRASGIDAVRPEHQRAVALLTAAYPDCSGTLDGVGHVRSKVYDAGTRVYVVFTGARAIR